MTAGIDYRMLLEQSKPISDVVMEGYTRGIGLVRDQQDRQAQLDERALKMRAAQEQMIRNQQAFEDARSQQLRMDQDIAETLNSNDPQRVANLAVMYPDRFKGAELASNKLTQAQKDDKALLGTQLYSLIKAGRLDQANEMIEQRTQLDREDLEGNAYLKAIQKAAKVNPVVAANMALLGAAQVGGEKVTESVFRIGEEDRAQELQPFEIKAKQADLRQAAANIGLTKAQTNRLYAESRKIGLETDAMLRIEKLRREAPNIILDPKKKLDVTNDLRKDYINNTKDYAKAVDQLQSLESVLDDLKGRDVREIGPSDVLAIVNFIKINDPTSTVTTQEGGQIQGSSSIFQSLIAKYNKTVSDGGILTDNIREGMKLSARKLIKPKIEKLNSINKEYTRISNEIGINPQDVIFTDFRGLPKEVNNSTPQQSLDILLNKYAPQ